MDFPIRLTREAAEVIQPSQLKRLTELTKPGVNWCRVSRDFSLPEGWLFFDLDYGGGHYMNGGVSPEGEVHT
jgi:hypothetical protein